jgi:hypothetical protein
MERVAETELIESPVASIFAGQVAKVNRIRVSSVNPGQLRNFLLIMGPNQDRLARLPS